MFATTYQFDPFCCFRAASLKIFCLSLLLGLGSTSAALAQSEIAALADAPESTIRLEQREQATPQSSPSLHNQGERQEPVQCAVRCIHKNERTGRETVTASSSRRVSSVEMCRTWCNRFCFGPQGVSDNGLRPTHLECSH